MEKPSVAQTVTPMLEHKSASTGYEGTNALWIDASLLCNSQTLRYSVQTRVIIWSPEFESGLLIRNLRTMMGFPPQTQATCGGTFEGRGDQTFKPSQVCCQSVSLSHATAVCGQVSVSTRSRCTSTVSPLYHGSPLLSRLQRVKHKT